MPEDDDAFMAELLAARRSIFAAHGSRLDREALALAERAPERHSVVYDADRERLTEEQPLEQVEVGETFPLVRFMIGHFRAAVPGLFIAADHNFTCNRLLLTTREGRTAEITVQVLLRGGLLVSRFAATPYCPAEGYRTERDDLDLDARHSCLQAEGYSPLEDPVVADDILPISPARLQLILVTAGPNPAGLGSIGLELAFPGGARYTTLGAWADRWWLVDEYYPSQYGPLASSPWVPSGLALFAPTEPNLLTAVRARFVETPDPKARFRDTPYPGFHHRRRWPAAYLAATVRDDF